MLEIMIDARETKLINLFKNMDIKIETCQLPVGDIVLNADGKNILIERKTATDFIGSIYDGRLFDQAKRACSIKDAEVLYLIVGDFAKECRYRKINKMSVIGALNSLIFDYGIKTVFVTNNNWASIFVYNLAKKYNTKNNKKFITTLRKSASKYLSDDEKLLYILQGFPSIGPSTSKKLLEKYGSLNEIFKNDPENLNTGKKVKESLKLFWKKYDGDGIVSR